MRLLIIAPQEMWHFMILSRMHKVNHCGGWALSSRSPGSAQHTDFNDARTSTPFNGTSDCTLSVSKPQRTCISKEDTQPY